jgi:hypothetical protein
MLARSGVSAGAEETSADAAATAANSSEFDSIRDAAARGASGQRGILQPTAADAPVGRRVVPHMSSRKATELGMPAVKPPAQPRSNGDWTASAASKPPESITGASESAHTAPAAGEGIRSRTRTAPLSPRDPSFETTPGTLAAARKAEAGATSPVSASDEAKVSAERAASLGGAADASARRADEAKPAAPSASAVETIPAAASGPQTPVKVSDEAGLAAKAATSSGAHAPLKQSDEARTQRSEPQPSAASSVAANLPLPIPRSALGVEPTTPSTPIAAAQPGASFDVEALFDDKLEPERPVISAPDDATDPKAKLDRDPEGELSPARAPRTSRPRGLQSWPLLAGAGVLALVAIGLSARACSSSEERVDAAPHVLQPRAEPPATPPAATPAPPPSAAPVEPSPPPEQAAAEAPTKQPEPQPAAETAEAKLAPEAEQRELATGKTLTAQQAKPLPQSLRGGVVAYRANSDPQIDYKAKGRELFSSGKYMDAADAYQRASQKTPSDPGAFAGLGASWLAAGQPEKAISAYQRALQLKPQVSGFQAALGRAYLQKGDRGRAASAYRKALELDPQNSAAKTGLQNVQ